MLRKTAAPAQATRASRSTVVVRAAWQKVATKSEVAAAGEPAQGYSVWFPSGRNLGVARPLACSH